MKKLPLLLLFFIFFSCSEDGMEQIEPSPSGQSVPQDVVTDASGRQYPFLDPSVLSYCGPGWGRKFCRFLGKYEGTVWTDAENYYSDFADVNFSNFSYNDHFISFFHVDIIASHCEGWKLKETTRDGKNGI